MSEEAAAVAAPGEDSTSQAPTVDAPETAAPEAPVQAPPEPQESAKPDPRVSKRTQMRRQAHERAKAREAQAEAARQRALEQPRKDAGTPEGGQFTKEGEEEESAAQPEAAEQAEVAAESVEDVTPDAPTEPEAAAPAGEKDTAQAPAEEASTQQTSAAGDKPAPGVVMIPLAEDHPYRRRGITEWPSAPHLERETRGMLNAVAERGRLVEEQEILKARLKAQQSDLPYQPTPRMETLLADIEKQYSPEEAALMRRALDSLNERELTRAEMEARQAVAERHEAERLVASVQEQAAARFPVWAKQGVLDRYMVSALNRYGEHLTAENRIRAEHGREPLRASRDHFFQWAGPKYAADPAVVADYQARQQADTDKQRKRIRAEEQERLAAEERKRLEQAAERHSSLPPATSGVSSAGSTADVAEQGAAQPRTRKERRQAIHQRYAGR